MLQDHPHAPAWAHKRRLVGTVARRRASASPSSPARSCSATRSTPASTTLFTDANAGTDARRARPTISRCGRDRRRRSTRPVRRRPGRRSVAEVDGVAAAGPVGRGLRPAHRRRRRADRRQRPAHPRRQLDRRPRPQPLRAGRGPGARRPPTRSSIDRAAAEDGDLAVGDTTTVHTPAPVPVTIVGIATFGDEDGLGGVHLRRLHRWSRPRSCILGIDRPGHRPSGCGPTTA